MTLFPGRYAGPVRVERPIVLQGEPGALIAGAEGAPGIVIAEDDVVIRDVGVRGGETGVLVREANNVRLDNIDIRGSSLHGIEVVDAHAHISDVHISNVTSRYSQGIEVRNAEGRQATVIERSVVKDAREGIVSHVSHVVVRDNVVAFTGLRAIAITEMSRGWAHGNAVRHAEGAGLYCGDMSRCEFSGNAVGRVAPGEGGRSAAGWGLVVQYYSTASSDDDLSGVAGRVATFLSGRVADRSPLRPGHRWGVLGPIAVSGLGALTLLAVVGLAVHSSARRLLTWSRPRRVPWMTLVLYLGALVQSFHMGEHVLQVVRVHGLGVPSRGGLVGPSVETEWVHFLYNVAILVMVAGVLKARASGWTSAAERPVGDALMASTGIIQGYHVVEHIVKLAQHVSTGDKVNPGILGAAFDLVWLHFALNVAVYVGFIGACIAYLWPRREHDARASLAVR